MMVSLTNGLIKGIPQLINFSVQFASQLATMFIDNIPAIVTSLQDGLQSAFSSISSSLCDMNLTQVGVDIVNNIVTGLEQNSGAISEGFNTMLSNFAAFVESNAGSFGALAGSIVNGIVTSIGTAFLALADTDWQGIFESISNSLSNFWSGMMGEAKPEDIAANISHIFSDGSDGISNFVAGLGKFLRLIYW